jgi:GNAT superfamily N-acetyltransferase
MGSRSLLEGPYRDQLADNPEESAKLALSVMNIPNGKILLAEESGQVIGLLGFIIYPHYFSGEITAGEIMWYVEPEFRKSFTALALLRKAESMARAAGAKRMQFTAPSDEVGDAYKALGYQRLEVSYQKVL